MNYLTVILPRPFALRYPAAVCDLGGNPFGLVVDGWRESTVGVEPG